MHDGPVHMRPQQPGCTFTIYSEFGMKYQFRESAATFWPLATAQLLGRAYLFYLVRECSFHSHSLFTFP